MICIFSGKRIIVVSDNYRIYVALIRSIYLQLYKYKKRYNITTHRYIYTHSTEHSHTQLNI